MQRAIGNHGDVIATTAPLVVAHPWRERLIGLRAAALAVAGRQQEALACLRDHRDRMVDDLGVDPWPELECLQVAILAQDPALTVPLTGRQLRGPLVVTRLRRDGPATVHRGRLAGDGTPVDIWVVDRAISDDDRFVRTFPGRATTLARLRSVGAGRHVFGRPAWQAPSYAGVWWATHEPVAARGPARMCRCCQRRRARRRR